MLLMLAVVLFTGIADIAAVVADVVLEDVFVCATAVRGRGHGRDRGCCCC